MERKVDCCDGATLVRGLDRDILIRVGGEVDGTLICLFVRVSSWAFWYSLYDGEVWEASVPS